MTHDDDDAGLLLVDNFKRMNIAPTEYRFFGKSSGAMLISKAIELKKEYTGEEQTFTRFSQLKGQRKDEFWTLRPVRIILTPISLLANVMEYFCSGKKPQTSFQPPSTTFQNLISLPMLWTSISNM